MPRSLWRLLALLLGGVAGLAVAELGARLFESNAMGELVSRIGDRIDDPILEYRTAPLTGENDAGGHRNPERLERADVVALGDSQTWGVNAEIDETWPARLSRLSGLDVYNMGRGGYGVVQYLHQLDAALALEPDWIVIAIYLGNDVHDAYALVYGHEAHASRRHPDPGLRVRIERSEFPDLQQMFFARVNHGRELAGPRGWLLRNSALYRLVLRGFADPIDARKDRAWARAHPDEGFVYDDGTLTTVFHTRYRLAAVDARLPRIREGLRITLDALEEVAERVRSAPGTRLLVVLLPTKERVFERAIGSGRGSAEPPGDHARSVREEARIAKGLLALLRRLDVRALDPLPALQDALDRGEEIFPANADGHFTPRGYRRIAELVAESIASARAEPDETRR